MKIISEHFKFDGKPKKAYAKREVALKAVRDSYRAEEVYQCKFCGKWHRATLR